MFLALVFLRGVLSIMRFPLTSIFFSQLFDDNEIEIKPVFYLCNVPLILYTKN